MKTRIRIAFTIDVPDSRLEEGVKEIDKFIRNEFGSNAEDYHVVAVRGGDVLAEVGSSPKERV